MSKCLVAYYSFTGNTAKVATEIAKRLSADLEVITEMKPRKGIFGALFYGFEAVFDRIPPIRPGVSNVKTYDLVILGCPVWAQKAATPMRAYVRREKNEFPRIAGFCTEGGSGGEKALLNLAELAGKTMDAQLIITEADLKSETWIGKVGSFVNAPQFAEVSESEPVP